MASAVGPNPPGAGSFPTRRAPAHASAATAAPAPAATSSRPYQSIAGRWGSLHSAATTQRRPSGSYQGTAIERNEVLVKTSANATTPRLPDTARRDARDIGGLAA